MNLSIKRTKKENFQSSVSIMKYIKHIIIALSLLILPTLQAQDEYSSAGAFLNLGAGARALAMGSAYTSIATGPEATYWNPAGLSQIQRIEFTAMYSHLAFDQMYNFVSAALPVKSIGIIGVSWIGHSVSKIEARTTNSIEPDRLFGDSQNAFLLSIGRKFVDFFSVGINLKMLHHSMDHYKGSGLGIDAGFLYAPGNKRLKLGFVFQNIQTRLKWEQGNQEIFPLLFRMGISCQIIDNLLISADITQKQKKTIDPRIGVEYRVMGFFPLRVGLDNMHPSMGLGLKIYAEKVNTTFDYSLTKNPLDLSTMHRLSISLEMNR